MSKVIKAIYCEYCKSIIYSLSNHHMNYCECGKIYIDAKGDRIGFESTDDFVQLNLNKTFLYDNLLELAYRNNGKLNIELGKFKIVSTSNESFYKQAICNWDMFKPYFNEIVTKSKLDLFIEAKEKGLVQK
jgi:hypothetical protein